MDNNPYAAPEAELHVAPTDFDSLEARKATRGERFGGAFIDGLLSGAASYPVTMGARTGGVTVAGSVATLVLLAILVAINLYLLQRGGQTIGKKVVGTMVVRTDGSRIELSRIILLRWLPLALVSLIPFAGGILALIDACFIFRADRRCLHDQIADTIVVKV